MSPRVYLDEDVDVSLAAFLATAKHDCLTAAAAGKLGIIDDPQLEFAATEGRILLTHN